MTTDMEKLVIAGREFNSRLFLGTGKFNSDEVMEQSILASGTEMVTVAMKRIELDNKEDNMLVHIQHPGIQLLPNTSGVRNAEEAVFAAQMAREAFGTNWLKLEIHPDPRYLLPDSVETLKATEELVKLGFVVLPYCQADPTLCKRLEEAGQSAYQWGQFIVDFTGLWIIRIHLVNRCHDPLGLKFCQNQNTHHDQDTHGNHDRNGMYYRGQRALCGAGYTDDAAIVHPQCGVRRPARFPYPKRRCAAARPDVPMPHATTKAARSSGRAQPSNPARARPVRAARRQAPAPDRRTARESPPARCGS